MTTEQIRKNIHVSGYAIHDNGLKVYYTWYKDRNEEGEARTLILVKKEAIVELIAIGEIDSFAGWDEFRDKWIFSQWDALRLVERHEYRKSLETDTNMLELDKALEAFKNM